MQPTPFQLSIPGWFHRSEFAALDELLHEFDPTKPHIFLEIGSYYGRSTSTFIPHLHTNPHAHLICVDSYDEFSPDDSLKGLRHLHELFAGECLLHQVSFLHLSTRSDVFQRGLYDLLRRIPPNEIDLAFIDGRHDADSVCADINLVLPLLAPGATLCGHDFTGPHANTVRAGISASRLPQDEVRPAGKALWVYHLPH